jgi:uncharacterized protein YceH (UPF0502 family)
MELELNAHEVRVLGCLLEKELATPEYYPLSLNALVNACNQKTNRLPVLSLSAEAVTAALRSLREKQLVVQSEAGRVAKYWQSFGKQYNLVNRESALLSLLLLRGPQTPGELRSRAENMCPIETLDQVQESLSGMAESGLVTQLPRQPGQKEQRYAHLLAGAPEERRDPGGGTQEPPTVVVRRVGNERIEALEEKVARLELELEQLRGEFLALKELLGD